MALSIDLLSSFEAICETSSRYSSVRGKSANFNSIIALSLSVPVSLEGARGVFPGRGCAYRRRRISLLSGRGMKCSRYRLSSSVSSLSQRRQSRISLTEGSKRRWSMADSGIFVFTVTSRGTSILNPLQEQLQRPSPKS